jgi:hypothetical protein
MSTKRKGQKGFSFVDSSILFLFFQTGSGEEIKKVEHVQRDEAEEEDKEETEDELRSSHDDIHFEADGVLAGSGKNWQIVALKEASARSGGGGKD